MFSEVLDRVDVVLRRLLDEVVIDAVIPVQEKHRGDLKAPAQGIEYIAGHIAFGISTLGRFRAVNIDIEFRIVEGLFDARIHDARDLADLAQYLVGDLAIAIDIRAIDLDVNRRRQPEVQNLRHHIGRQERERGQGKFPCEIRAQAPHIIGRRMVVLFE